MATRRSAAKSPDTKLFVLDTNVLMHDPTCLYRFEEHDVFVPIMTLEELDNNKKGMTEVARNARQASRTLDDIVSSAEDAIQAGIPLDALTHSVMLPQDSAAAFVSGGLDIDVNYIPFSRQSLQRKGAHTLKTSLGDRTWERGLISEAIACNQKWLAEKPEVAAELMRAWFEAVDWWKEHPEEGNALVAKGLDWPDSDARKLNWQKWKCRH